MAKAKPLPGTFSLLHSAWDFSTRHTALPWIAFWLLAIPSFALSIIDELSYRLPAQTTEVEPLLIALLVIAIIGCIALLTWGTASVLMVGRRQIQNRAGRSRTSIAAACGEAEPLILPLIGTSILQTIFLIYRALLYTVPATISVLVNPVCTEQFAFGDPSAACVLPPILLLPLLLPTLAFAIQTSFYQVVLATENMAFREGLDRSRLIARKHTWKLLPILLGLVIVCYGPSAVLGFILDDAIVNPALWQMAVMVGAESLVMAIGTLFFLLGLTTLYGALREKTAGKEVKFPKLKRKKR